MLPGCSIGLCTLLFGIRASCDQVTLARPVWSRKCCNFGLELNIAGWPVPKAWMSCFGEGTMKTLMIGQKGSAWLLRCETSMQINFLRSPSSTWGAGLESGSEGCNRRQLISWSWRHWSYRSTGVWMLMTSEWSSMPSNKNPGRGFRSTLNVWTGCFREAEY